MHRTILRFVNALCEYNKTPVTLICSGVLLFGPNAFAQSPFTQPKDPSSVSEKPTPIKLPKKKNTDPFDDVQEASDSSLHKHSLGIGLGETFLSGDYKKSGTDGITLDAFYDYSASHSFDFVLNAHYSKHNYQNQFTRLMGVAASIKAKAYQYDNFSPFVLGGLGFYMPQLRRYENGVLRTTDNDVTFGFNLGTGVDLRLGPKVKVGILLQYHNPFDLKQDNGSSVSGRYYKLMLTSMYTF